MIRNILIIFDNQAVCPEALDYARQFALRMNARVTFLVLIPKRFSVRPLLDSERSALSRIEDTAEKQLLRFSEAFIRQGIEVTEAFKVGEPVQELLKFLAGRPPFQAVIWGSSAELPGKGHWIGKVSAAMEGPLLAVNKKERR